MSLWESLILGIIQGITEFLPVSSSGHLILVREFMGIDPTGSLTFDVLLHGATLLAVVLYFRRDIYKLCHTALNYVTGRETQSRDRLMLVALILGTLPAAIIGVLWGDAIAVLFRNPETVAWALIGGSVLLMLADRVSYRSDIKRDNLSADTTHQEMTVTKGLTVGLFQILAFIPGASRSGVTIAGGLLSGLSRREAIRFAFLLALPVIGGSAIIKFIEAAQGAISIDIPSLFVGTLSAFVSGYVAVRFLTRFLEKHNFGVFIVYRILLALLVLWVV